MTSKALKSAVLLLIATSLAFGQQNIIPGFPHAQAGRVLASQYANWRVHSTNATAVGAATMILDNCFPTGIGSDNRAIFPFAANAPIAVVDGANSEVVTPSSVASPSVAGPSAQNPLNCSVTATFANAHGVGATIASGDGGLAEAVNDAALMGASMVTVDYQSGLTPANIAAMVGPYQGVQIEYLTAGSGAPQYFSAAPSTASFLAAPATLTAVTALPSATPVGAYGTGTYHLAIAYVDADGQVGPESADFSEAGLATGSFIFSAPVASTGAVGYVMYISLTSGTYSLDYEVPVTSTVCRMTTVETVTPACAVTNALYGQTGAAATVTAITVSTSPVGMSLGGVSGTLLTGNPNGRTTYAYLPSSHPSANGMPTVSLAFTVGGIGSATPIAIGTVNLPPGVMNYVGKRIRVCGREINTDVNSAVQNINIYWDAAGSDVAGSPVKIGSLASTQTGTAAAYNGNFCEEFTTTVSGAGATAGSIQPGFGMFTYLLTSANSTFGIGGDTNTAAIGSLNLAGGGGFENRLSIVHTNTTGNATPQLLSLTIESLN